MLRLVSLVLTQVTLAHAAWAQTTPAAGSTVPVANTGVSPIFLLIIVALIAAAVWYFMRRRSAAANTSTPTGTRVYDRDKP